MAEDLLLEKYNEYTTVVGYTMRCEFVDGGEVSYTFHKKNFPHLIGLQKLIDIPIINDFNASKIGSVLKSNYILFENKGKGFDHLGIAVDKLGRTYVETFFYNSTDLYIKNQKIVKIKKVQIFDDMGNLYFEDNFI